MHILKWVRGTDLTPDEATSRGCIISSDQIIGIQWMWPLCSRLELQTAHVAVWVSATLCFLFIQEATNIWELAAQDSLAKQSLGSVEYKGCQVCIQESWPDTSLLVYDWDESLKSLHWVSLSLCIMGMICLPLPCEMARYCWDSVYGRLEGRDTNIIVIVVGVLYNPSFMLQNIARDAC